MSEEKIFADGIRFQEPGPNAPTFVRGKISVKIDDFIQFLQNNVKNGWVNLDIKKSKKGTLYLELNTWQKGDKNKTQKVENGQDDEGYEQNSSENTEIQIEELPF